MKPRKRFGQHFLHDGNVIRRIIAAIDPQATDHFVEIGPGKGALTLPLLASGVRLSVVEIDRDLARELPGRVGTERCSVYVADALRFDFRSLAAPGERLRLAANLPYNISTPLLFHLLDQGAVFRDLHVMLQKEVGERMVAPPGNRTYGRLTVTLALRCRVERLFAITPGSFTPPPKVDSVFLRLVPHTAPLAATATLAAADRLLAQAFTMRRKCLRNGLKGLLGTEDIRAAGLDEGDRPEVLPPEAWLRLAARLVGQGTAGAAALARPASGLPE